MNDDNEFIEHWRKERKRGKVKYVLSENKVFLLIVSIVLIIIFSVGYITQVYDLCGSNNNWTLVYREFKLWVHTESALLYLAVF